MRHLLVFLALFFFIPACPGQEQQSVSPDQTQKLFKELAVERPGDSDLTKLMRERFRVAQDVVAAHKQRYEQGQENITFLGEAQKQMAASASEMLEGKDLILVLAYIRDTAKVQHERAKILSERGVRGGGNADVATTRFQLLDAEVRLLREVQKQSKASK